MRSAGPIYCIGDSHVCFFSGEDTIQPIWPNPGRDRLSAFRTFRLGAVLAYSLAEYGSSRKGKELLSILLDRDVSLEERAIPPGVPVLLCFGEIDCRAHVFRQAERQERSLESVVSEVVDRYFSAIEDVLELGYQPIVWGVVPSTRAEERQNPRYPHYGTCRERNEATRLFNTRLEALSTRAGIPFVSIFDELIDDQGLTRTEYYMDDIHLSQRAMPVALAEFKRMLDWDVEAACQTTDAEEAGGLETVWAKLGRVVHRSASRVSLPFRS